MNRRCASWRRATPSLQSTAAAIEEENEDAARFVIKLLSGSLLCGMGSTDLTFSALDKEQRSVILKTLESLAVA